PQAARGATVRLHQDQVDVPAGATVSVTGRVRIRRPQIIGADDTHAFSITARGRGAPEFTDATVRATPLFRRWALVTLSLILVVALWAGLAVAFIPRISAAFKPGASSTQEQAGNG